MHVVYGLLGLKTHARSRSSCAARRTSSAATSTSSTGNYNPTTARLYTDLCLFTARDAYAEDVSRLFNLLTGYSRRRRGTSFIVAPLGLHERVARAHRRARRSTRGRAAGAHRRQDERAGRRRRHRGALPRVAGGRADRPHRARHLLPAPGRARASARTSACVAIVDRFLEHARIFYFDNGGKRRGLPRRAPTGCRATSTAASRSCSPSTTRSCARGWSTRSSASTLADNVKARRLLADGTYVRVRPEGEAAPMRSQYRFMELAREKAQAGPAIPAAGGGPYQVRTTPPPPRGLPASGGQVGVGAAAPVAVVSPHT